MRWLYMNMTVPNQEVIQTTTVVVLVLHLLCFQASSTLLQGVLTEDKMRLGSTPPSCYKRCNQCHPCTAVQVPTTPIQPGRMMMRPLNKEESNSLPTSTSKKSTDYKPLGWKCKCGNRIFNP